MLAFDREARTMLPIAVAAFYISIVLFVARLADFVSDSFFNISLGEKLSCDIEFGPGARVWAFVHACIGNDQ